MIENLKLINETCTPTLIDATFYQHMVGKLIYFTNACLNLIFVIRVVGRHMATPQEAHLDAVKGESTLKVIHFCSKKVMYNKYYSMQ
jgi:hypothetical protein